MVSEDCPESHAINRRLMEATGFVGLASCETKRHAETGEVYLIEVNVRVPIGFGLAQACGVDGPWRLYCALAGIDPGPQPPQRLGVKVLLPFKDVPAIRVRMRAGELTFRDAMRSWSRVRDAGSASLRDPLPFLAQAWSMRGKARPAVPDGLPGG
jgi:predicted ATP-grasp superfamily ATP-dependent carboligase